MSDKIYSIKELAEEFNVSKAAIHRYLTDDFRAKYVETVSGKTGKQLQVNSEGYRVLYKHFISDNQAKRKAKSDNANVNVDKIIDTFKQQLEEKDRQIERLQLLLNQSQQLQLKESKKLEKLELKEEERRQQEQEEAEFDDEQSEEEEEKTSFWRRLFG